MEIKCKNCNRFHHLSVQGTVTSIVCACGAEIRPDGRKGRASLKKGASAARKPEEIIMKKELSALIEISRLLVSTHEKETLLCDIFQITREVMQVEAVSILLHDKEKDDMAFYLSEGPGADKIREIRLARGEGLAGWVFLNRKSVVSQDTSKDGRFCEKVDSYVGFRSRNLMAVPIFVGKDIIGVMEAVNKKKKSGFGRLDLKLFESIANHVGEVLEKARLIEENIKSMRLAAVGQTLASLSHSIKNILSGLGGGSYIVNKGLSARDLSMVEGGWDVVEKCVSRITDLSMNMLAYSKERIPLYTLTDPNKLVVDVSHMLSKKMEENGISFSMNLDRRIKEIPLDSYGIFRCLLNLLTNALEACPRDGGKIEISTLKGKKGSVLIRVGDNGPGIGSEIRDKIFSVFFSTTGDRGTGLGLAVTKKIIEEHKGKIWIESEPGAGTCFFLELPSQAGAVPEVYKG